MMLPGERLWLNITRWSSTSTEKNVQELFQEARLFVATHDFWSKYAAKEAPRAVSKGVRGEATQPWLRLHKLSGLSRELSFTSRTLEFPGKLGPCNFFQSFGCWACPGLNIPVAKWGMRAYQQAIGHQLCLGGLMAATFGHHWQGNCLMNVIRRLSRDNNG